VIPQSFETFDWDEGNREKFQKHGVSINEIEEALTAEAMMILPDLKHSDEEDRFIATGSPEMGVIYSWYSLCGKVMEKIF